MRRKFQPFVLFNTDDPAAATPPVQTEPAAVQPAAPAPPQPVVGDGPWSRDIQSTFQDPEIQRQVDAFLRSRVQPHVTQIEQEYAPARELWQDLQGEDSISTFLAVAEQLYGAEVAQAVAQQFEQGTAPVQAEPQAQQPTAPQFTPEQQAAIDWAEAQRAEQLFRGELDRVLETDAGAALKAVPADLRDQVIAPFVQAAEGDFDQAIAAYNRYHQIVAPQQQVEQPPAPPTLDAAAPAAVPPTTPPGQSLDAALDSFLAEQRAGAPATVGQV